MSGLPDRGPQGPDGSAPRTGWAALARWGDDAVRIEPLTGGAANDVWLVRVGGRLAVGRLGTRSDADLAWETGLLRYLGRAGLTVPAPIPAADGRLFADGLVVMTHLEGGPPESPADWRRVAGTLRELHRLTRDWPQRPGWRSSADLLHAETGTRVDLRAMPREGVARCRAAWARLAGRHGLDLTGRHGRDLTGRHGRGLTGRETSVVHGDPNPGNVLMTADRVALIDWDEAHVDDPLLDLLLPGNAAGLDDGIHDIAAQASAAWEAAVCWGDEYAVRRLAEVRA
ncbi:phosphotransferase [Actinoplanes sp. NPDC023714]|uniref:phosphotransferase enzyme family protein n=1 Tax=Actinoplanes sp. NPDC023714 TaxID=3154322 RepID=UPI0034085314